MTNQGGATGRIPDKLYFRIGEVSRLVGVPSSVLRYWETEFTRIRPKRTAKGQRLYRRSDLELLLEIKHLLYERKFTIKGARKYLSRKKKEDQHELSSLVRSLKQELEAIRKLVE